jgi:hypothetical protein
VTELADTEPSAAMIAEVGQVLNALAIALDDRDRTGWLAHFVPSAELDFSAVGLAPCSPKRFWELITGSDARRIGSQHLLGNLVVRAAAPDAACAHTEYSMTSLNSTDRPGRAALSRIGGFYKDELVRTGAGWLIGARRAGLRWSTREEIDHEVAGRR